MSDIMPFLPQDRVASLVANSPLPSAAIGTVLFADISGFSTLTSALVDSLGRRRGAEVATRTLNRIYDALLAHVHSLGGYVISFSGDGSLCWFPTYHDDLSTAAMAGILCAQAMIEELAAFQSVEVADDVTASLGVKVAVTSGKVRRMLVGDPAIQRIEVLAGRTVDRVGLAERLANRGEVIVDSDTAFLLRDYLHIATWRVEESGRTQFAVVETIDPTPISVESRAGAPPREGAAVPRERLREWLLPSVYERLVSGQEQYLAELRPCVALFGRFTGLDYDNDPKADSKLDGYVRWVQRTVDRHGGALIQLTTGDKGSYFYAAFGAPVQHGDAAIRAASAALDLRTPPQNLHFRPQAQIGLARGRMRVGAYGSDMRRTYGVQGEAVNLAARIMMLAPLGAALVTADLSDDLALRFQCGPARTETVKGSEHPVAVRELLSRNDAWTSVTGAKADDLYGREAEIDLLGRVVAGLTAGRGQFVRVHGPAGIGKSRIVAHMTEQLRRYGVTLLNGACEIAETNFAYYAIKPLLLQLLGLQAQTNDRDILWRAIQDAIPRPDPSWRARIPLLGDVFGAVMEEDQATRTLSAQLRQEVLINLIVDIIVSAAETYPLAIGVEDVQWADEASQAVLLALIRAARHAPLLVVCNHRPAREGFPFLQELSRQEGQLNLALGPLGQAAVGKLLNVKLGAPAAPLLASFVFRHAQGNPFFTGELVDSLIETEQLRQVDGLWTLDEALTGRLLQSGCLTNIDGEWQLSDDADIAAANLGLPDTVQEAVLARADRLPADVRLTLRVAAVAGRTFSASLVANAHPDRPPPKTVMRHLGVLAQRDFIIVSSGRDGGVAFSFRHSITQEAIYGSMLEKQLRDLHLAVARLVERDQPDNLAVIAYHFARADVRREDVRAKAMHYLEAAALHAKREYANETALSLLNQALTLGARWKWLHAKAEVLHILGLRDEERAALKALEETNAAPAVEVACAWADYHDAISQYPEALQRVGVAMEAARQMSDQLAEARAHLRAGAILRRQGLLERAEDEYVCARRLLDQSDATTRDVADAIFGLGAVYRDQGDLERAEENLREALSAYHDVGARVEEAHALEVLGFVQLLRHRNDQALAMQRKGLEVSRSIGDRRGEASRLMSMAQAQIGLGDYSEAQRILEQCLLIQQRIGDVFLEIRTLNEMGIINFLCGQYDRAADLFRRTRSLCDQVGDERMRAFSRHNLGQTLRDAGQLEEAEVVLGESVEMMHTLGFRYNEAGANSDLAMLHLYARRYDQAVQAANRSLAMFRELGAALSTTTDLATLAEAHRRLGHIAEAEAFADSAIDILDECGGSGPDYPQRDYHLSALALIAAGRRIEGEHALKRAAEILSTQSEHISDPDIRESFLHSVPHNRDLIRTLAQRGASIALAAR